MKKVLLTAAAALTLVGPFAANSASAQPRDNRGQMEFPQSTPQFRQDAPRIEPQRDPRGYAPIGRPNGVDARPRDFDRQAYAHNFQAQRTYHIGPYHAPSGFRYQRWHYGQFLPGPFWVQQFWLTDYWLFGLDIPPIGYEWVRYGNDVLLVNIANGEVVECVYSLFV